MDIPLLGIHHVTAIASDPQQNIDFYTSVFGLRLVKLTVNFDDPGTYHLYYGDETGRPGTILTFFPWPGSPKGRRGVGQVTVTAYSISQGSLGYWIERLKSHAIPFDGPVARFNEEVLTVYDPDGLVLELVSDPNADLRPAWENGPVPAEHSVRGFFGLTLTEGSLEKTQELLTEIMGFRPAGEVGSRCRFELGQDPSSKAAIDLLVLPGAPRGRVAAGAVHHVAWRAANDEDQQVWQRTIAAAGLNVTPVMDRQYFRSIYFREPGGVLFEIATDPPGFATDEGVEELGTQLKLPPWLEPRRSQIEATLPPVQIPRK